jgi:heme exporter protein C
MSIFQYASPARFYPLAGKAVSVFGWLAAILCVIGLYIGFVVAPTDFQQGESYRIIFIHVPSAWMAMVIYLVMAAWSAAALIWNTRLSAQMAEALAPTGAMFAFVALWSGAFWGRPTWGTYWVWDARLTSTLILLFLYLGFMALKASIDDPRKADRAASLLAIVGAINVPIIYFSVRWWNTLHQGSSVTPGTSKMASAMLSGMLIMTLAAWAYAIAVSLHRVRSLMIEREAGSDWVKQVIASDAQLKNTP